MAKNEFTTATIRRQTHNVLSRTFDMVISGIHQLYEVERDCIGAPDGDSAFDHWLCAAEAKRREVMSTARFVGLMPATTAQYNLQELAHHLVDLFEATDAANYSIAAQNIVSASPVTRQIFDFQNQIAQLLTLPDYIPDRDLYSSAELSLAA